jgi:hypothetical protein
MITNCYRRVIILVFIVSLSKDNLLFIQFILIKFINSLLILNNLMKFRKFNKRVDLLLYNYLSLLLSKYYSFVFVKDNRKMNINIYKISNVYF